MRAAGPPGWPPAVALVLLVLAVYLPTLGNGFVWDDRAYVLENPIVNRGLAPAAVLRAFTSSWEANWHPLTWISHMADVQLFGMRPAGHHLVNVLLHAANAVLLCRLLAALTGSGPAALLAAALFAAHPLHVESVAWVAERKDLLSTLFGLLAALAWLRAVRRPAAGPRLLAVALFAASLMAKPMLVTLPFLLLLLDAWPLGRLRRGGWPAALLEKLPFLALSAASSAVTLRTQSPDALNRYYALGDRVANAAVAYAGYLVKTAWPSGLAVFYPHPGRALPAAKVAAAAAALAALTALALLAWRRRPWLAVGWLWYLGTLVPVIGIVQVGSQAMADRYTYLPLAGLFLAASHAAAGAARRSDAARRAVAAAAAAVVAVLAAVSVAQALRWRDAGTLFEHALAVTRGNYVAHEQLGIWYQGRGDLKRAEEHYRADLALQPTDAIAYYNLGLVLERTGRPGEALRELLAAWRLDPTIAGVLTSLGRVSEKLGRLDEAAGWFAREARERPQEADARLNHGAILVRLGRAAEAEREFAEAARLNPADPDARANLAVVLAARGDYAGAAASLREALRLKPGDAQLRGSLEKVERLARP